MREKPSQELLRSSLVLDDSREPVDPVDPVHHHDGGRLMALHTLSLQLGNRCLRSDPCDSELNVVTET